LIPIDTTSLEDEHGPAVRGPERAEQRDDVGVRAQRAEGDRLAFERLDRARGRVAHVEQLERDTAPGLDLAGAEHGRQAADADLDHVGITAEQLVAGVLAPAPQHRDSSPVPTGPRFEQHAA
jgi:hypothetical protein